MGNILIVPDYTMSVYHSTLCLHSNCSSKVLLSHTNLTHSTDKQRTWKKVFICLLVFAAILCVIGVALWIAVGIVVNNPPNGSK